MSSRVRRRVIALASAGVLAGALLPQPTTVAASTGVAVGTNASSWADSIGMRHVVGEVTNGGPDSVSDVLVTCSTYDASNTRLAMETRSIEADVLLPTEKSPFDILLADKAGFDHFSCAIAGAPTTTAHPNHNFTTTLTSVGTDDQGHQVVSGTVVNNNDHVAGRSVKVMLTSYDDGSTFTTVEDAVTVTLDGPIQPGASVSFSVITNYRPWDTTHWVAITEAPSPWLSPLAAANFPDQVKGTTSAAQQVTVLNVGTADLHVLTVQITGDFAVTTDGCTGTPVPAGTSCTLAITFTPTDIGPRSGILTLTDDAEGSPPTATLTGTGLRRPFASLSTTAIDFGSQLLGSSVQSPVQIMSTGLDPLLITGVTLDETTDFAVDSSACTAAIPVGSSCTLTVTFAPQSPTAVHGTITITHNGRNSPQTISFNGTGVTPVPGQSVTPTTLDFGSLLVGGTSAGKTVTLSSTGTARLTVTSIAVSGDFHQSHQCANPIPAGGSCVITVTFAPTASGPANGALTIVDDLGTQTVTLTGIGTTQTVFYFAEGFTGAGFTESLSLLMPNHSGQATIEYFTESGALAPVTVNLVAGKVSVEDVNHDVGPGQNVSARVTLPSPGIVERSIHFRPGIAPWHGSTDIVGVSRPATEWDFAEGSTLSFFSEYLTLQNPNPSAVTVDLQYFTDSGAHPIKTTTLPANSRTTVEVFSLALGVGPGIGGVSVKVLSRSLPIVAERPMYVNRFSFGFGPILDGHVAFGANAPARQWSFAEGTTLPGFNEYLTLQNPGSADANVSLRYQDQDGMVTTKTIMVPGNSRATVEVFNATLGVGPGLPGVSVQVTADQPIVAERPMYIYRNFGSGAVAGAHVVVGSTGFGKLFGFASASTLAGDNHYLTIQNPNVGTAAHLTITYYTPSGPIVKSLTVPPNTRATVEIFTGGTSSAGLGAGQFPVGIVVVSDAPVLVEKPTYSANPATYGATDTLGYSPPAF